MHQNVEGPAGICKVEGCGIPVCRGSHRYCKVHKHESVLRFKAMLEAQRIERAEKLQAHESLYASAHAAGTAAPAGDGVKARVIIRPAGSSFARWIKAKVVTMAHEHGGMEIPVPTEGYALAFARTLQAAGLDAFGTALPK
jgi:hypothetical protein